MKTETAVDYIKEVHAFYEWLELNELPQSAVLLWHALMHLNDKAGQQARSVIEAKTRLKKDAYYNARNQLKTAGIIDFKTRGNRAAVFTLFSLLSEKKTAAQKTNSTVPPTQNETFNIDRQKDRQIARRFDYCRCPPVDGKNGLCFKSWHEVLYGWGNSRYLFP